MPPSRLGICCTTQPEGEKPQTEEGGGAGRPRREYCLSARTGYRSSLGVSCQTLAPCSKPAIIHHRSPASKGPCWLARRQLSTRRHPHPHPALTLLLLCNSLYPPHPFLLFLNVPCEVWPIRPLVSHDAAKVGFLQPRGHLLSTAAAASLTTYYIGGTDCCGGMYIRDKAANRGKKGFANAECFTSSAHACRSSGARPLRAAVSRTELSLGMAAPSHWEDRQISTLASHDRPHKFPLNRNWLPTMVSDTSTVNS